LILKTNMELMLKVHRGKGNKGLAFLLSEFEGIGDIDKLVMNFNKKHRGKRY